MLQKGKVNIVLDLYYGSSGKGQICAKLADEFRPEILIANHSTSASHTVIEDEHEFVFKALPSASFLCKVRPEYKPTILLASSSGFEIEQLYKEVEFTETQGYVYVHPLAVIIEQKHKNLEAGLNEDGTTKDGNQGTVHLGSTMSGQSYAFADKMTRKKEYKLAKDYADEFAQKGIIVVGSSWDFQKQLSTLLNSGASALAEMPQGFPLSLDHGPEYPYSTFRNVTPIQLMADLGLNQYMTGAVIANVRSLPIRVSNRFINDDMSQVKLTVQTDLNAEEAGIMTPEEAELSYSDVNAIAYDVSKGKTMKAGKWYVSNIEGMIGTSGPFEDDMEEISWRDLSTELTEKSGKDVNIEEITTLTKLNRRVAKIKDGGAISSSMLEKAIVTFAPTHLSMTFLNYIDPNIVCNDTFETSSIIQEWFMSALDDIDTAVENANTQAPLPHISIVQFGPALSDVRVLVPNNEETTAK